MPHHTSHSSSFHPSLAKCVNRCSEQVDIRRNHSSYVSSYSSSSSSFFLNNLNSHAGATTDAVTVHRNTFMSPPLMLVHPSHFLPSLLSPSSSGSPSLLRFFNMDQNQRTTIDRDGSEAEEIWEQRSLRE